MAESAVKEKTTEATTNPATAAEVYLVSALVQKDENLDELVEDIKKAGAQVKKSENLGAKHLFVKINGHTSLTLVSVFFTAAPAVAHRLGSSLKAAEYLERFLLTTWRGDLEPKERKVRAKKESSKEEE